ncbi:MAG TPA: VWA domain-containing protein [Vicinamibacteria bacterium]|nr:VWA domain-containing protein [Vicinamibacteria bacterium]
MRVAAAVLLALGLSPGAAGGLQTEPPPSFPAGTELVTVDVVVLDKQGMPVTGLSREDFTIAEEGKPQELTAFEAVDQRPPPSEEKGAAPPALRPSSNVGGAALGRSFAIVFDEVHMSVAEAQRGRLAVTELLKTGVADRDRVALVGTSAGAFWSARIPEGRDALLQVLGQLQGRRILEDARDEMSDWEAMRIEREHDPIVTDRVVRRFLASGSVRQDARQRGERDTGEDLESQRLSVRARAAQVYSQVLARNEATLSVLERSFASLESVRGRKSVILVSGGFINDPQESGLRRAVTESRRANAALYFLDTRGLTGVPSNLSAESGTRIDFNDLGATLSEAKERSEGSHSLAVDTGGFSVENDNDLKSGLERIAREASSYYLLGYAPADKRSDGRFRKIEVKVGRPGLTLRARRGYYAPGGPAAPGRKAAPDRDAAIQSALDSPFDLQGVPLRTIAYILGEAEAGKLRVLVTTEADIRGLAFEAKGGAASDTLETMLVVAERQTGEFHRFDQQFVMSFKPETRARYERTWFPMTRELELAPGTYQARLVARDKNNGRVGSLTHTFEVDDGTGFRISTPLLSDRLRDDGGAGPRLPEPIARRVFAPSGTLHSQVEVFGAAKDAAEGTTNVTAGFSVRRSDGRFLAAAPETPIKPGPDGSLARTLGIPLDSAPPGRYELILVATDLVAGQVAERREAFDIEPAPPPR